MNERLPTASQRFCSAIHEHRRAVINALIVAAVLGVLAWGWNMVVDYFEDQPLTIALSGNATGETSIRPFFEQQIRPQLREPCTRSKLMAWIGERLFDQYCTRLAFEPHSLEDMITRRLPYRETAEPQRLLELFVGHHQGCLSLRQDGDTMIVEEPPDSQVLREGDRLVCP